MVYTIELTPEEFRRVERAKGQGFDLHPLLRGLIAALPEGPPEGKTTTKPVQPQTAEAPETNTPTSIEAVDEAARRYDLLRGRYHPRPTRAEREAFFQKMAEVNKDAVILPPEAFDRENLYEDRL